MPAENKKSESFNGETGRNVVIPISAVRHRNEPVREGEESMDQAAHARRAVAQADKLFRATRLLCLGLVGAWLIAWPVGNTLVHMTANGTFALRFGYSLEFAVLAAITTGAIFIAGYALSVGMKMEATAQRISSVFGQMGSDSAFPQSAAAREQINMLNAEIDKALGRLADAESLIRQQVRAIDSASNAIESGAVKSTERLERERQALMDLTEEMNREAEQFADKIAERTKLSASEQGALEQRLIEQERELQSQLQRLEAVSAKSLDKFEELASAMEGRTENLTTANAEATERQSALANTLDENAKRLSSVQSELVEQSARLEALIKDQRRRADRLAKILTEQAGRVPAAAKAAAASADTGGDAGASRRRIAWKDILATVEDALPVNSPKVSDAVADETAPAPKPQAAQARPAENTAAPAVKPASEQPRPNPAGADIPDAMDRLIHRIHNFSLVMQTQLFEGPSHEDLDRFESGERQLFARSLIAREAAPLKLRIAEEVSQNAVFKQRVTEFLRDFDTLLEPLSTEDGGEAAIESYLGSPIGRLYILTGSSVGHFS